MRRLLATLLAVVLVCSMSFPAFAAEEEKENNVTVKYVSTVEGAYVTPVQNGAASINADGVSVNVTGAPSNAKTLVVIPMTGDALSWIDSCVDGDAKAAYDIHFEDAEGNRINANGATVTIDCPSYEGELIVCSVSTDETTKTLTSTIEDDKVTFATDGSNYYIMAEALPKHDVEIEDKPGGDVEIDKPNPETGEDVTITPDPDDGKVVGDVIVKDEDGNEIPVIDNGDGTYTYEQPDGDVTIEVIFKDKTPPTALKREITPKCGCGGCC